MKSAYPTTALVSLIGLLMLAGVSGCEKKAEKRSEGQPAKTERASSKSPESANSDTPREPETKAKKGPGGGSKDKPDGEKPLEILAFQFTTGVKHKRPLDKLARGAPGMKAYGYLKVRNLAPNARKLHLIFRVNEKKRTVIDLKVSHSWSYRTWAYNTLRKGDDHGVMTLEILDEKRSLLAEKKLPLGKAARVLSK